MLDYDTEADHYDATRGGEERALAAAAAVERLLPADARTLIDLACGTGIVTRYLQRPEHQLTENQLTRSQATQRTATDNHPTEHQAGGPQTAHNLATHNQATHDQATDNQATDNQATGRQVIGRQVIGRRVIGVDRSPGMLVRASHRLPRAVVLGDAIRLPIATASVDAVVIIWLLHLLPDAAAVLAEAARVLQPGGVVITTVDKNQAAFAVPSDLASVTRRAREPYARAATDRHERILDQAAELGLHQVGETSFRGTGQGRSPRQWQELVRTGGTAWFRPPEAHPIAIADLTQALAALPDQDSPRPDPHYRLIALARQTSPGRSPGQLSDTDLSE